MKIGKKEDPVSRLISLTSVPGKIVEQNLIEAIYKYMRDKRGTSNSKHRFMKVRLVSYGLTGEVGGKLAGVPVLKSSDHCEAQLMTSN